MNYKTLVYWTEKILLLWGAWYVAVAVSKVALPSVAALLLFPVVSILNLFTTTEESFHTMLGLFMGLSVLALVGGIFLYFLRCLTSKKHNEAA